MEFLRNVVFDWCSSLVINMKKQLNYCKLGKNKNFKYPIILTAFFFDHFPALIPKATLPRPQPCEPRITRWEDVLVRQGGGDIQGGYDDDLHSWWSQKVLDFEKF